MITAGGVSKKPRAVQLVMTRLARIINAVLVCVVSAGASGADWPQYRFDAGRTAACPQPLPAELHGLWERQLPAPRPAFPGELRLRYDATYEPVVMGKTMFVPSMVTDSVTALDTETGRQTWQFFAEGPVRLAPVAWQDKVYFVSDDGYLYCVGAADGRLKWKFRGLPAGRKDRKVMGDGRLVSVFPARGGPVLADGILYFAAGIWSDEGVFVHALKAESGQVVWSNTDSDRIAKANADHGVAGETGLSPQGHLAIVNGTLIVPCGAQLPALMDLKTGNLHTYTMGWGGKYQMPKGCVFVSGIGKYLMHGGDLYDMGQPGTEPSLNEPDQVFDGLRMIYAGALTRLQVERTNLKREDLGDFREPALTPDAMYYQQDGIVAFDLTRPELRKNPAAKGRNDPQKEADDDSDKQMGKRFTDPASVVFPELWMLPDKSKVHIKAGSRLYCGGPGAVEAVDIPSQGETPRISWRAEVQGTPHRMLAADGKLFVVTLEGRIYAFAGSNPAPPVVHTAPAARAPSADQWTAKAAEILGAVGITDGYILVLGLTDARLAEELVRQSRCNVIAVEADAAKAAGLRERFQQAGLYGCRIAVLVGDPTSYRFPPYLAGLIVLRDPGVVARASDAVFLKSLFRSLRPYGGTVCLELPAAGQQVLAGMVSAGEFQGGLLRQKGDLALLRRQGPLAGTADWSHAGANAANTGASQDRLVKPPLTRLWFDGAFRWPKKGGMSEVRVAGGRVLVISDELYAMDAYTGRRLWQVASPSGGGKLVALEDAIYMPSGRSCVVLDPATGKSSGEMSFPGDSKGYWSSIRVSGEILVAASGDRLACIDRKTGRALWEHQCENAVNSIAVGGGKVFCTDTVNRRRFVLEPNAPGGAAMAFDARSGKMLWKIGAAGEVLYSEPLDVLVIGSGVYRGKDGRLLWSGAGADRVFIVDDNLISYATQGTPKHAVVAMCDLLTGEKMGSELEWWQRGCTVLRAGSNLLTTRYLGNAAYFDLASGQMTSISNVRAACSNNLFPADGVLNMPNLSGGCTCNYMPISQGFVPSSAFE
jgi:outer membrane protein assembly factor BamB